MSEFESQADDNLAICPYCKETYQPEAEDYSEDELEIECFHCEKKFYLSQVFSVSHQTRPSFRMCTTCDAIVPP